MQNLERNISFIMNNYKLHQRGGYYGHNNRPSINDSSKTIPRDAVDRSYISKNRYNMILTQTSKGIKYDEWLRGNGGKITTYDFWNILFQISVGCYAMSLSKMAHNDLHDGNIFIDKLESETEMLYIINDKPKLIKTTFKAYIYDFDRGYAQRLGPNNINQHICNSHSSCNSIINNRDLIKIICYIIKIFKNNPVKDHLLDILTDNDANKKEILDMFDYGRCFLQDPIKSKSAGRAIAKEDSFYHKLFPIEHIITNIQGRLPNYPLNKEYVHTYKCNKKYFNADGKLNIKNIKEGEVKKEVKGAIKGKGVKKGEGLDEKLKKKINEMDQKLVELDKKRKDTELKRTVELKKYIIESVKSYSDKLIIDNFQNNKYENSIKDKPIDFIPIFLNNDMEVPEMILEKGRRIAIEICLKIGNNVIINNDLYQRYMTGEEGLDNNIYDLIIKSIQVEINNNKDNIINNYIKEIDNKFIIVNNIKDWKFGDYKVHRVSKRIRERKLREYQDRYHKPMDIDEDDEPMDDDDDEDYEAMDDDDDEDYEPMDIDDDEDDL